VTVLAIRARNRNECTVVVPKELVRASGKALEQEMDCSTVHCVQALSLTVRMWEFRGPKSCYQHRTGKSTHG